MNFDRLTDMEVAALLTAKGIDAGYKDRLRAELAKRSGRRTESEADPAANTTTDPSGVTVYCMNVIPMGKPRMVRGDKWKRRPSVERYWGFCRQVRTEAERTGFTVPDSGLSLLFLLPMPPSWSRKKRAKMSGEPHQQKPDVDNIAKGFLDALMDDDCTVWQLDALEKRWADEGAIVATVKRQEARDSGMNTFPGCVQKSTKRAHVDQCEDGAA